MIEETTDKEFLELSRMTLLDVERVQGADFETAVHYCKYGKFQRLLLTVCGIIYATCAISTTTLSFVLPSAECDFNLTSMDKGKLSAMPIIGMIFGCGIWGSLADAKGRKMALILCLLLDFFAASISSFSKDFSLFLACRFFNGFGIIGATSIIFPYCGEFLSKKHRDVILGRLEIFWNVGIIILPGLAWILLSHTPDTSWIVKPEHVFKPWRVFVLFCGVPSLISALLVMFMPETPKYLISKDRYEDAKGVFQKMFSMNTSVAGDFYPVLTLDGELETNNNYSFKEEIVWKTKLLNKLKVIFKDLKTLLSQPYLRYILITSFVDFGLMSSYYTLIMWFPEIFERFNQFEVSHPGESASVCVVSETISKELFNNDSVVCNDTINQRVFIDTIIIALSCLPTSVSLSFFMKTIGKKRVLVFSLILSGLSTLSLNWVGSSTETLILSCFFEALTSILEAVLFCVVVDLFPTNLRAIAISITVTSGRLGAIIGNVIFGMLIDLNCVVPIYLFGFLLILSAIMCLAIPETDNYFVLH